MKEAVEKFVLEDLNILKSIEDSEVYHYIITTILKVYSKELTYVQAIDEIEDNIDSIAEPSHINEWGAVYSLCQAITGQGVIINHHYNEELLENREACIIKVTGEIYHFIHDNE